MQEAARNPALFARANGGHPAIAATVKPAAFTGPGVVSAHGAAPTNAVAFHASNPGANTNAGGAGPKLPQNQLNTAHPAYNNAGQPKTYTATPKGVQPQGQGGAPKTYGAQTHVQSAKPPQGNPKPAQHPEHEEGHEH